MMSQSRLIINLLILLLSIDVKSNELFITGESFHSSVSSFIKNIDPNIKVSISTREISGNRDAY